MISDSVELIETEVFFSDTSNWSEQMYDFQKQCST